MGVEIGVTTRMAQVVWPMMIVTVANFEGFNFEIFAKMMWILGENEHFHPKSTFLPSEALKICHSNYHHRPHNLSYSCGHTPFHTYIN